MEVDFKKAMAVQRQSIRHSIKTPWQCIDVACHWPTARASHGNCHVSAMSLSWLIPWQLPWAFKALPWQCHGSGHEAHVFSPLFRVYVCTMGYVPGNMSLQVIRDDIPQLARHSTVPLRTGTAVHVLFVFFHRDAFCRLFCDHGLGLRKISSCENIIMAVHSAMAGCHEGPVHGTATEKSDTLYEMWILADAVNSHFCRQFSVPIVAHYTSTSTAGVLI